MYARYITDTTHIIYYIYYMYTRYITDITHIIYYKY